MRIVLRDAQGREIWSAGGSGIRPLIEHYDRGNVRDRLKWSDARKSPRHRVSAEL
jgi:hypothetical protein